MIRVSAVSILTEACNILKDAKARGINVPSRVSREFRDLLYSAYRDELISNGIDTDCIGQLLGNSARWDINLCRYFTLRFLKFFVDRTPQSAFDSNILTNVLDNPQAPTSYPLKSYDARSMSAAYAEYGPTLFLEQRTMAIKARVQIPNVTKRNAGTDLQATNLNWINMKFRKSDTGIRLLKIPVIAPKKDPITKKWTLVGVIRGLPGDTTKYGFCELATGVRGLISASLKLLVGDFVSETDTVAAQRLVDYVSLIENKNIKFCISKDDRVAQLTLFSDTSTPTDPAYKTYRINGDDLKIYLILGTPKEIKYAIKYPSEITEAFDAYSFNAIEHNLYNYSDSDSENVQGLLFSTNSEPIEVDSKGIAYFDADGIDLSEHEILSVCEISDSLSR